MPIFIREDRDELLNKEITVPDKIVGKAKEVSAGLGKQYPNSVGTKRIKKIADGDNFNKKGNEKEHSSDGTFLSFGEIKKAVHDMEHQDKNSIEFKMNGGQDMLDFYKMSEKQIRNASKQPQIVKSVTQQTKAHMRPPQGNVKQVKPVTAESKKFHITKRQVDLLESKINEYREEQRLPFEEEEYALKHNLEHFVDYLQLIGKSGTLRPTDTQKEPIDYIREVSEHVFELYVDDSRFDINYHIEDFLEDNTLEDFPEYYNESFDGDTSEIGTCYDVKYIMTKQGYNAFMTYLKECFWDAMDNEGFLSYLNFNEGMLYIERGIEIPRVGQTHFQKYSDTRQRKDFYEYLINKYGKYIGNCWSWYDGGGEVYCGGNYKDISNIILVGKVRLSDIDWYETVYRNVYELSFEKEIFLDTGTEIEVDSIKFYSDKGIHEYKLPNPIIVEA